MMAEIYPQRSGLSCDGQSAGIMIVITSFESRHSVSAQPTQFQQLDILIFTAASADHIASALAWFDVGAATPKCPNSQGESTFTSTMTNDVIRSHIYPDYPD